MSRNEQNTDQNALPIGPEKKEQNNHYLAGRQAWAETHGSFIQERNLWRMVAIGAVLVAALALTLNIIQANKAKVLPYVIEVDKAGKMHALKTATAMTSNTKYIQYSLGLFVSSWRSVTADIGLQERHNQKAGSQVAGAAHGILSEWYKENNPFTRSEKSLVEVRILGLPLLVSGQTWQVEWEEITRGHSGETKERVVFQGNFQIQVKEPKTEAEILENPSGIYVVDISFTKKLR